MVIYEDRIEVKMLVGDDLQAPLPEDSLKAKRPDGEVKASDENEPSSLQNFRLGASPGSSAEAGRESHSAKADDLCVGSTSHQRWLPRLDSNQDTEIQNLMSYH